MQTPERMRYVYGDFEVLTDQFDLFPVGSTKSWITREGRREKTFIKSGISLSHSHIADGQPLGFTVLLTPHTYINPARGLFPYEVKDSTNKLSIVSDRVGGSELSHGGALTTEGYPTDEDSVKSLQLLRMLLFFPNGIVIIAKPLTHVKTHVNFTDFFTPFSNPQETYHLYLPPDLRTVLGIRAQFFGKAA